MNSYSGGIASVTRFIRKFKNDIVRPKDYNSARDLGEKLLAFHEKIHPLPGIIDNNYRKAFVEQLLESMRRVQYVHAMRSREISVLRGNAATPMFDPLKAAELQKRRGNLDEAFWLVFLAVHFGKHGRTGWARVRDVYGALGYSAYWTWQRISSNPSSFLSWLDANVDNITGAFGNHRKYLSLDAYAPSGTGSALTSYVEWINPPRSHRMVIDEALEAVGGDGQRAFAYLYRSMKCVISFGRIGRFDYLAMLGKMDLAPIEPDSPYMAGATGPLIGARLLLGDTENKRLKSREIDRLFIHLGQKLNVGMQVIEDAICNWQKMPSKFVPFRS